MKISNGWSAAARCWVVVLALPMLGGCMSMYVDSNTTEIDASQFKKPARTHPVQLFVEFQTEGVANDAATAQVKPYVFDQVKASGLFSSVSAEPVDGGASLNIVVNNVPLSDDAYTKGFVTGMTFGLVGSTVSDGYVCTARYRANPNSAPIRARARHAIHMTAGASSAPEGAIKAANADEAVMTMLRQIISNVLNDLSYDVAFE